MSKYRIVKVLPEEYANCYVIQVAEGESWKDLTHPMFTTTYNDFSVAEASIRKILELDKWNATHGKYQVLKEYD